MLPASCAVADGMKRIVTRQSRRAAEPELREYLRSALAGRSSVKGVSMQVLVLNSGSSSLKFSIYRTAAAGSDEDPTAVLDGELSGIGGAHARLRVKGATGDVSRDEPKAADAGAAADAVLELLAGKDMPAIDAVGYRVVHPGARLAGHQRITPEVLEALDEAVSFAPLHDPVALAVIRSAMKRYPAMGHFACFDTEFHRTMPEEAWTYAIPKRFRDAGVRRYGFHGLSCESVVHQMERRDKGVAGAMVLAHLGSGCSVTALRDGRSVDTSMGLTPDGGVLMGTRPGDLDPGLVLYLLRQGSGTASEAAKTLESLLNHESGVVALSGVENDMRATRKAAGEGSAEALLALKVFTRSITKTIGSFAWLLGGLDGIVFTGGIGEHDAATRREVLAGLKALGVGVDAERNEAEGSGMRAIGASDAKTDVLVVPAQEDLMIARHVARMMDGAS